MEKIMKEWYNIEKLAGQKVPLFLKLMLSQTGYDCLLSVKEISSDSIIRLEDFIQKNRNRLMSKIMIELDNIGDNDDSLNAYKDQEVFQFLPGHKSTLLSLPEIIERLQSQAVDSAGNSAPQSASEENNRMMASECPKKYSVILTELINTARNNMNKSKHANKYCDIVKYFAAYIFLLCGRICYETLCKNLPIPSTKTICKYLII